MSQQPLKAHSFDSQSTFIQRDDSHGKVEAMPAHTCQPDPPTEPSLAGAHTLPHSNAAVPALSAPIPVVVMTLCMPSRSSYQKNEAASLST